MSPLLTGDCLAVMAGMEPDSVDAIVTDPPYGLEFMGKEWDRLSTWRNRSPADKAWQEREGDTINARRRNAPDYGKDTRYMQEWHARWAVEALRVLKPGHYLLAFGGTRTVHRLTVALEDSGWIIRDMLIWAYACLSDDSELLTDIGWVPHWRLDDARLAAAFDTDTGEFRWEPIQAVHVYDHAGPMVRVGPSLATLNHRVVLSPESQVPLPRDADLRRLWRQLRDVGPVPGDTRQDMLEGVPVGAAVGGASGQAQASRGTQGPDGDVRDLRQGVLASRRMDQAERRNDVLDSMQWRPEASGSPLPPGHAGGLDGGVAAISVGEDERPEQPGLEGRRYRLSEAWELLGRAIRSGAGVGEADGSQGRIRDGAPATDGAELRLPADQDGMREPREPRPDGQRSSEPDAVAGQPDAQALRVGQVPAGNGGADPVELVDYSGVVWCVTVPSGAFVARRGGVAFVTGNSGFPKGRAQLKPAYEPIVLAKKPGPMVPLGIDAARIGTADDLNGGAYAETGGRTESASLHGGSGMNVPGKTTGREFVQPAGRWPANLVLTDPIFDGDTPGVVGGGQTGTSNDPGTTHTTADGWGMSAERRNTGYPGDEGTYSRFFQISEPSSGGPSLAAQSSGADASAVRVEPLDGAYPRFLLVPKSSRSDREPNAYGRMVGGLEEGHRADVNKLAGNTRYVGTCVVCGARMAQNATREHCGELVVHVPEEARRRLNQHPTSKPTALMRHLVRLVTPPGGRVLDMFAGSGSTLIAAELEGFEWVGIEQEPEYVAIAEARLAGVQRGLGLDVAAPAPKASSGKSPAPYVRSAAVSGMFGGNRPVGHEQSGYGDEGTPSRFFLLPRDPADVG